MYGASMNIEWISQNTLRIRREWSRESSVSMVDTQRGADVAQLGTKENIQDESIVVALVVTMVVVCFVSKWCVILPWDFSLACLAARVNEAFNCASLS